MDNKQMIDDFVKMMDSGMAQGVGHVNVDVDDNADNSKNVQTMGCTDCSRTPLACSVPTLRSNNILEQKNTTTKFINYRRTQQWQQMLR